MSSIQQGAPPASVDKRGERIRAMFAGVASRYDLLNHLLSLNIDKSWRRRVVKELPPSPGAPVLDVCTGTGDLALLYDRVAGGATPVTGADFCHEMLCLARRKNSDRRQRVCFVEADAQALPFPTNAFAIVTVAFGLRNVADTSAGLAEMVRVAKPGGKVAVLEFSRPRVQPLKWLYLAYFKHLLPWIGQSISKNTDSAYQYLPASVMAFPDGEEMADLMRLRGLRDVTWKPMTFGVVTLYVGVKPAEDGAGT